MSNYHQRYQIFHQLKTVLTLSFFISSRSYAVVQWYSQRTTVQ